MSAGQPTLDLEYDELMADEYKVYFDREFTDFEDEVTIDLVGGMYYQKLRVTGVELCG